MNHLKNLIGEMLSDMTMSNATMGRCPKSVKAQLGISTESLDHLDMSPYQAEIPYNKLLPYADKLDQEADRMFADIKAHLGKCIMFKDHYPGLHRWTAILYNYIRLFGLRFTKEDHIVLVKLFYELLLLPGQQPSFLEKFAQILLLLLKKKELLSPLDLQLPWRPLYDLCVTINKRMSTDKTMYKYPMNLQSIVQDVVQVSKLYFPPNATQEILDEIRPNLYFRSTKLITYVNFLQWFLPVQLPPEQHGIGHELWFHEFMKFMDSQLLEGSAVENSFMHLMAKLASNNIGYIDWNPYIPLMFTRFLCAMKMPIKYNKCNGKTGPNISAIIIAEWIASVLGDKTDAQIYLEKFLKTVETYFHPANVGRWCLPLQNLFSHLSYFVALRLYRERHEKKTWETPIPESHKLTDANVDAFVASMMPIATISIFNRFSGLNSYKAIQNLAAMRPNMVIPKILEKLYPLLEESTTERNKLSSVFVCMTSMLRPLVQGPHYFDKDYAYSEGPTHVFNFLYAALSAINMNEPSNCLAAMNFIKSTFAMIPIVDCSNSNVERSEEDTVITELTARFEDFILQFMDKIFALIRSGTHVSVRIDNNARAVKMDAFESMAKHYLCDIFFALQQRMSDAFFVVALNKLYSFVREENLEVKVAGQMVGMLCNVFSLRNGQLVLHNFVPYLADRILTYLKNHDSAEEHLDNQMLYPLLILKDIADTQGTAILPYLDTLLPVIDKVISIENHEINKLGCDLLNNLLGSLCTLQLICRENDTINDPNYPHWEDWGKSYDVESIQLRWYVPGEQELAAAQRVFYRYFFPAIGKIQHYIDTANSLSRNELQITLRIIDNCLNACKVVLPMCKQEESIINRGYENCDYKFIPFLGVDYEITMPNGENVNRSVVKIMTDLQSVMLKNVEDDTDSFKLLIKIWKNLDFDGNYDILEIYQSREMLHIWRESLEMRIIGDKGNILGILQKRVDLQHEWREKAFIYPLTQTTMDIILNLFRLSVNKYTEIRSGALNVLTTLIDVVPCCKEILVPHLLEIIQSDTEANEDAYIGVLDFIGNLKINFVKHDWQLLLKLIPAMVLSKPTEKLEAIMKLNAIVEKMSIGYTTTNIIERTSDVCAAAASKLWEQGLTPNEPRPDESSIKKGLALAQELESENLQAYYGILDKLIDAVLGGKLHWRHHNMATDFISILAHPEHLLPTKVVRYFVNALTHDSIDQRKLSGTMTVQILQQLKKKHPKITIEVLSNERALEPGIRADNEWLLYDSANWPNTAEKWDSPRYVHKESVGFYAWPKKLEIYAPSSEQPSLDGATRQASEQEKEVDAFFGDAQNVAQLVKFLSLEEKKGMYGKECLLVFKALFRNYGDAHLAHLLPHLRTLVTDTCKNSQRCAAEIVGGLIRGSKHWPFDKTEAMWAQLLPIVRLVLDNASSETVDDWLTCFSYAVKDRDPNRMFWLIEFLKDEALKGCRGRSTFNEHTRLKIILGIKHVQYWRLSRWLNGLLPEFKAYLYENPLKNVRDILARILEQIYSSYTLYQTKQERQEHQKISEFISLDQPLLKNLLDDSSENGRKFLNTLCDIIKSWRGSYTFDDGSFYELYPVLVQMVNNETYPELAEICCNTIALLASSRRPEHIPAALKTIHAISKSNSWSERVCTIQFIEVMLFYNMSLFLSNKDWLEEIRSIVLSMIEDERVEVRELAAKVLSGMLHCTLITDRQALMEKFVKMAKGKKRSKSKGSNGSDTSESIRMRHAGVLGMCAFIQAHPYDIPQDVPPLFEHLSSHLHEPEPILDTIRKTLSNFKRTHCDSTAGLQGLAEQLTPEQFELLQDLNVPPSYFS